MSRLRETNTVTIMNTNNENLIKWIQSNASNNFLNFIDFIVDVFKHKSIRDLSNFVLIMTFWCELKKITRKNYVTLRQILTLQQISEVNEFFKFFSILIFWNRKRLFILFLNKAKISIKSSKMLSNTYENFVDMFHLNSRYIITSILSISSIKTRMHFDMTNIVNNVTKLWQNHVWTFSIKICSKNYAQYNIEKLIIFSNFIRFWSLNFDKVIFFNKNRKSTSRTTEKIILFVQQI